MFYHVFHEHQPDPRFREDDEEVLSVQYNAEAGTSYNELHANINKCLVQFVECQGDSRRLENDKVYAKAIILSPSEDDVEDINK
jgi:hypothetical protein